MKPTHFTHVTTLAFGGLALLFALALTFPAIAQDDPGSVPSGLGPRTSPFDPPTEDVFVTDSSPGLDTGCTFNTDPNHPLIIDVYIDRVVGEVDGNGYLLDPDGLIAAGIIPANVGVTMPAYDIDLYGSPPPEWDEVFFNGQSLGLLQGDNGIWAQNFFTVDVRRVRFPAPQPPNTSPAPAANRIQINVDTLSSGRWCAAIDWVALVMPIRPPAIALKLEPIGGNTITVRDDSLDDTIDTIYQQSFDTACGVTTDIGHDDYTEYPFSGAIVPSGIVILHTTIDMCPFSSQYTPHVIANWRIAGTSLSGVSGWSGNVGDIHVTMPQAVGRYSFRLDFTIDGKELPTIYRRLLVTLRRPIVQPVQPITQEGAPRLSWLEKATEWAWHQETEVDILESLLSGLYSFGGNNWRYGYDFDSNGPKSGKCDWPDLVADQIRCDYSDCYVFSDVLLAMAATLGVGNLTEVVPRGQNDLGFLTKANPSLDPAFTGNAMELGRSIYDRYYFTSHSLLHKCARYYDATFNGIYSRPNQFIAANVSDKQVWPWSTDEDWFVYPWSGSAYDSWGNYKYAAPWTPRPIPMATASSPIVAKSTDLNGAVETSAIVFTGNVIFATLDEDQDGLFEALTADVEVELSASGEYAIFGLLKKGTQLIASQPQWESMVPVRVNLDELRGTRTVSMQFSAEQIYRSGKDGPYDLVLQAVDSTGSSSATLSTPTYDHTIFGEVDARFTSLSEAAVDADGDGQLDFIEVTLELDVRLPRDFRLQAALDGEAKTIVHADTSVSFTAGGVQQVSLQLDGTTIRRSGLDGPYDGGVNLIDTEGHTIDSITFTTGAYSSGSFAGLIMPHGSVEDQGLDMNDNALYDVLRVEFEAEVGRAGSYLLTGVLQGVDSPSAVYTDTQLTAAGGLAAVRLEFSGREINALELDGPYTVNVLVRDPGTLHDLDAVQLPQTTAAYQYSDFDSFKPPKGPIALTGNSTDHGVDTDANGLYDKLNVDVELTLAKSDYYEWSARLTDANDTKIDFYHRPRVWLNAGTVNIQFVFDGDSIGRNGVDGPYFVKGLLIFGRSTGDSLVSLDVTQTHSYQFTEFEGAQTGDVEPPEITISSDSTVLWPANHKYRKVAVTDFVIGVTDAGDPNVSVDDVVIAAVTSDEPDDARGKGDGATVNDIDIATDCRSVRLRAERAGSGKGRVYTIHVAAADASSNVGTASYTVIVPHDSSDGGAVDDGPAHTVQGCTP